MDKPVIAYRFDDITLDLKNRQLRRNGDILSLSSKYFDVLSFLVSRHGELATKQEIFNTVWGDVIVTDTALSQCIKDIRKRLNDDAGHPRYIKTVPKHGYIFIAEVQEIHDKIPDVERTFPDEVPVRPYKFLDYYTENDAEIFFGREEESRIIASKILAHRTFILHGRSGVGKSSVIRAGVVPLLKKQGHQVFIVRSFIDPLHQIRDALEPFMGSEGIKKQLTITDLTRALDELQQTHPFIFVFDQFEEFFSILSETNRRNFIRDIGKLWASESIAIRFVFVLREDLLAEMSQLKSTIPDIFHYEFRLKRLNMEQAAKAILEPARMTGCRIEQALIQEMLKDLSDHGDIDPPQLQIVCDALYDNRSTENEITVREYRRLGGAQKILTGYLERVLGRFNAREQDVVKNLLILLISGNKQRLVKRQQELEARIRDQIGTHDVQVGTLVTELIAARIIRCRRQEGENWIELAHDFLLSEISSWVTVEEYALKRAYGIIERALENYRTHHLLIDNDALDLVMPFGRRLSLTGEESDLLALSLLSRGRTVPQWLAERAPNLQESVLTMLEQENPQVRIVSIESCQDLKNERMKEKLKEKAFWDEDLMVRKAASIALARWFGPFDTARIRGRHVGLKRRAISMAFIRDHDKQLIHLSRLPFPVAVLVVLGLMIVRSKRYSREILIQTLGGTAGAALSGLVVGSFLGLALVFARKAAAYDTVSLLLVLSSLGTIAGAFGGFGISWGMVSINYITFRHSRWWSIVGAALGGAVIGAFMNILGVDILKALFGHHLTGLTGAFEGALIGVGIATGILFVPQSKGKSAKWKNILGASLGAMTSAIFLTLIGGNLFSGSLDLIARSFADSQLQFDTLATFFGESQFGRLSRVALGGIEGLLFGGFMAGGIELLRGEKEQTQ